MSIQVSYVDGRVRSGRARLDVVAMDTENEVTVHYSDNEPTTEAPSEPYVSVHFADGNDERYIKGTY